MVDSLRNVNELFWVILGIGSVLIMELERCRAILEDIRDRLPPRPRD